MINESFPIEAGSDEFLLELDVDKDVDRSHSLVGQTVVVTDTSLETMCKIRGERAVVKGVIQKYGQIAGLEVEVDGKTYWGPKKDFHIEKQFVEDIHLDSSKAVQIKHTLRHWARQRDYLGVSWDGIEYFHYQLAKAAYAVGIEAAGWYEYSTSDRKDMDGKDWRLLIPDGDNSAVAVNCHSLLHDGVWTLSTTIFSTRDIIKSEVGLIGSQDHWERVLLWSMEVARELETNGFDYSEAIQDMESRLRDAGRLYEFAEELMPVITSAHQDLFDSEPKWTPMSLGFSRIPLSPGSIGVSIPPTDEADYTIVAVHPKARKKWSYAKEVVRHELIHTALGSTCDAHAHGERFQALATAAGLPEEYHD